MATFSKASSTSVHAATVFLTQPLLLVPKFQEGNTCHTAKRFLYSALLTASGTRTVKLCLSPSSQPPLPVHLACVASGIKWSDWAKALGGIPFVLVIEPEKVYIVGRVSRVIWAAVGVMSTSPSLDQRPELISEEEEDNMNDPHEILDAQFSPSSRPSSRSSNFSSFSFSSVSSHSSDASSLSSTSTSPLLRGTKSMTVAVAPLPSVKLAGPTRYIYQGGISTVLTGGVMLGCPTSGQKKGVYVPPQLRSRPKATAGADAPTWRRSASFSTSA